MRTLVLSILVAVFVLVSMGCGDGPYVRKTPVPPAPPKTN